MYFIQHCFICRLSDSTVSENAGIETRGQILCKQYPDCCDLGIGNRTPLTTGIDLIHIFGFRSDVFDWSLHHSLHMTEDIVKWDGRAPSPSPAWANFFIILECTPESGHCHSLCALWFQKPDDAKYNRISFFLQEVLLSPESLTSSSALRQSKAKYNDDNCQLIWKNISQESCSYWSLIFCERELLSGAFLCKPFQEPRNRFSAWRASTTTLFDVSAR